MHPSLILLLILLVNLAEGNVDIRKYEKYRPVGSAYIFPPVPFTKGTVYDLQRANHNLVITFHEIENIRPPYSGRSKFYKNNGTFVLENLREDDSGLYEQKVNMTLVAYIRLYVIELVKQLAMQKVNETIQDEPCQVILACYVQASYPHNVTFLKDGKEVTENVTRMDHSSFLSLDTRDPQSAGTYTCRLYYPLGTRTSGEIQLLTPDKTCRKGTFYLETWQIIFIIFMVLLLIGIIIGIISFIVYKKCPRTCRDGKSEDATPEEVSTLQDETRRESNPMSMTDEEEAAENMTLDILSELDASVDNSLEPGHYGEEGRAAGEPALYVVEAYG